MTFTTMEPTLPYDAMLEQSSYHKKGTLVHTRSLYGSIHMALPTSCRSIMSQSISVLLWTRMQRRRCCYTRTMVTS